MRRESVRILAVAVALVVLGGPADTFAQGFQIVVNTDVQGGQIPREALSLIFLKKAGRWGDGSPVAPVDQSLRSEIRAEFSRQILEEPVVGIQIFWNKQMARGIFPPPVKPSDEEVLSYVASTPGAIGYIASGVPLPRGVRTITVVD